MKKILYVTTISGFLPQFEKNDVKIIQNMGYKVHYASNFNNPIYEFNEDDLKQQGITCYHIDVAKSPVKIMANLKAIFQIKRIIDQENISLIHCHNPMGAVTARLAAYFSKKKPYVIYTAHGFHFYEGAPLLNWLMYYPVEKVLARLTNIIVTINKEDYNRANEKFTLKKGGFIEQIHGVGVDMNKFKPNVEQKELIRRELSIPEDAFHIVTAAELNENKNQKVIIKAISKIKNQNIYYSICGKGPNEQELRRLIKEYQLEDRVKLYGFRTDMEKFLLSADVFAFPSIREGLGIAAVEALGSGIPLLVADNRGSREYAQYEINSMVCRADNVLEFKEAIEKLQKDSVFRQKLADHARVSVDKFSMDSTTKSMSMIYKKADEYIFAKG